MKLKNLLKEQRHKINEVRGQRELDDLRVSYHGLSKELAGIIKKIENVATSEFPRSGVKYLKNADLEKEVKVFQQIQKLFKKSNLGKVLK